MNCIKSIGLQNLYLDVPQFSLLVMRDKEDFRFDNKLLKNRLDNSIVQNARLGLEAIRSQGHLNLDKKIFI